METTLFLGMRRSNMTVVYGTGYAPVMNCVCVFDLGLIVSFYLWYYWFIVSVLRAHCFLFYLLYYWFIVGVPRAHCFLLYLWYYWLIVGVQRSTYGRESDDRSRGGVDLCQLERPHYL